MEPRRTYIEEEKKIHPLVIILGSLGLVALAAVFIGKGSKAKKGK